ncbi:hypothetical protein TNCV_4647751 [Trichonephila clavipes]|uniref:Uncharacterized protein n=1 Tax=Trichonephila clavipes TaxID=2585209 RepID=A0A8X6SXV1_TRICX|nr:hypothetical protein TNCV_4647751 [Trichonephila clavipes]
MSAPPVDGEVTNNAKTEICVVKIALHGIPPLLTVDRLAYAYCNNVTLLLRRRQRKLFDHCPYSPDMSPCDFHRFRS